MHPIYDYIKRVLAEYYAAGEAAALGKWILTDCFHLSAVDLYAGKDTNFSKESRERLEDILSRLKRYEPLQYITGETSFCGLPLKVTPAVLIPRPETEELIDWIVADNEGSCGKTVLDVGTGSGCIPIALAVRLKKARVFSWDVSEAALQVAAENVARNAADVTLQQVDVLQPDYPEFRTDILVSNPPYITEKERNGMDRNVLDWEPDLALFVPDDDPLVFYRRIAEIGWRQLVPSGTLYYEINQAYGGETTELLRSIGYVNVELRKDLSGNDRMIKAVRP